MSAPHQFWPVQNGYSKVAADASVAEDDIVFQNAPKQQAEIINPAFRAADDQDEWDLAKWGSTKEPARARTCGGRLGRVLCGLAFVVFLGLGLAFVVDLLVFAPGASERRAGAGPDASGRVNWASRPHGIDYVVAPPPDYSASRASTPAAAATAGSGGSDDADADAATSSPEPAGSGLSGSAELGLGGDPRSPDRFTVVFNTTCHVGTRSITVAVTRALAPLGADRFYALVMDEFFDQAAFFRVVPNFVVQFGISGVPQANRQWDKAIQDDPVKTSNLKGTITYATAGPNTRTTQLFFNTVDNAGLDADGFAPFGHVTQGMDVVENLYDPTPGSSDGVDQDKYTDLGNEWIIKNYPKIDFVTKAAVVKHGP